MIKERIKKLFALARDKGANENEAARALEAAQRLMMRHGINGHDLEEGPPIGWGDSLELTLKWHQILTNAVAHLYAIISVDSGFGQFKFVGKNENVAAAEATIIFLIGQVESLYKQSLPKGLDKKKRYEFRKNFKEGCAVRILDRVIELVELQTTDNNKAAELGTTALVVRKHRDQLMDDTREYIKGSVEWKKTKPMSFTEGFGFSEGSKAGNMVQIHKTVQ